jgi:hypothetical protein
VEAVSVAIYVGTFDNKDKYFSSDEEALDYAFDEIGIKPARSMNMVTDEFKEKLLQEFYRGDWIVCSSEDY